MNNGIYQWFKKCSTADDYQNVFDNEVKRLSFDDFENDNQKLTEAVNRLKKEIEDVMKSKDLDSELVVLDFKRSSDLKSKFISKVKDVSFIKI